MLEESPGLELISFVSIKKDLIAFKSIPDRISFKNHSNTLLKIKRLALCISP